jgi:RimJ/RimL family protein N-acetyltransferase
LNCDDTTPTTLEGFVDLMRVRGEAEWIWGVRHDQTPCGVIAFFPVTDAEGEFHGICFDEAVWGLGIAERALRVVLVHLAVAGIEEVRAGYFAENQRVHHFLRKLGAVDDPSFVMSARCGGQYVRLHGVVIRNPVAREPAPCSAA